MPTSIPEQWLPIVMQTVLAMVIACALVTLSYVIGRKVKNRVKDMPYECGIAPTGDARATLQREVLSGGDAFHPVRY